MDTPFTVYAHKRSEAALGVLTPRLGLTQGVLACFAKQLDSAALGWLSCLRAVIAIALLVNEASKLTLGLHLVVLTPHQVQYVLEVKEHHF